MKFVSVLKLKARIASTTFLDEEEEARVRARVDADLAWFKTVRRRRTGSDTPKRR